MLDYHKRVELLRDEVERTVENSARLAHTYASFDLRGQGATEIAKVVDFGLTFIERPIVAVGVSIDLDDLRDTLDVADRDTPPLPAVSGFVTDWDQDQRDFYLGAWVAASVYFPYGNVDPELKTRCSLDFTFSGVALKDIPVELRS